MLEDKDQETRDINWLFDNGYGMSAIVWALSVALVIGLLFTAVTSTAIKSIGCQPVSTTAAPSN